MQCAAAKDQDSGGLKTKWKNNGFCSGSIVSLNTMGGLQKACNK
jgi:hypothetical protein